LDVRIPYDCDVVVLGAGAAGLFAATRAAEAGARVILLEKNRRAGVKILMSGGTRCNLTNARGLRRLAAISGPIDPAYNPSQCRGSRAIAAAFGPAAGAFLGPALKSLDVDRTVRLFEAEGLATKVEANGKIFPASDRATDVVEALLNRLARSGAELRCGWAVRSIERLEAEQARSAATERVEAESEGDGEGEGRGRGGSGSAGTGFRIDSPAGSIRARRVILAVGGQSYPGCGTSGDGYAIAGRLGHTIVSTRPALVPIRVDVGWVMALKGLTLPDVSVSVCLASGRVLQERREAVLFAHFGLTGPAILDVSRAVARHEGPEPLELRIDLLPDVSREAVDRQIQEESRRGRRPVLSLLPEAIPRRLGEALLEAAAIPIGRTGPELSRDERRRLVGAIKPLSLPLAGSLGFEKAEVTSGGVSLEEVDPTTLESRLVPGFHLAGEVLDLDGLIGGYNFQAAWSTGWLAGEAAARALAAENETDALPEAGREPAAGRTTLSAG
jgi:predicted flavoprotein YhiN